MSEDAIRLGKTAYIHLAVDTGMSRIGMYPCRDSADLVARISKMPGICVEGMFTHLQRLMRQINPLPIDNLRNILILLKWLRRGEFVSP